MSQGEVRSQKSDSEVRERQKQPRAAKPAPPADPRHQPFFTYAYESYKAKHGRVPVWTGKDRNALKNLLRGQSAESLPLELLTTLWQNFCGSTELFTVRQHDSLSYFCSNLDKFSDGPMLQSKGKANGRDINEAVATTMHGAFNSGISH
jgi:hypothetical protein